MHKPNVEYMHVGMKMQIAFTLYNTRGYPSLFGKAYKQCSLQHRKKPNYCISLPTATVPVVTVHVHHTCSVASQVWSHDMHLLCVGCVNWPACACQNCVQWCVHTPVFEVLHALNVQAHMCAYTCVWSYIATHFFSHRQSKYVAIPRRPGLLFQMTDFWVSMIPSHVRFRLLIGLSFV